MTKEAARALADRYGMGIRRDPVTREAWGCSCESEDLLPELDELADCSLYDHPQDPVCVERLGMGSSGYVYVMHVPAAWFDLWGWKE